MKQSNEKHVQLSEVESLYVEQTQHNEQWRYARLTRTRVRGQLSQTHQIMAPFFSLPPSHLYFLRAAPLAAGGGNWAERGGAK